MASLRSHDLTLFVRAHGYRLFNINNLKLARFKEIFPAAAKSDPIDARKGLELFQLSDHLPLARGVLQEVGEIPQAHEMLKRLSRRRRDLVEEKTRILNRLQSDLQAVCPDLLSLTKDAENVWFLSLLTARESLPKLARLTAKTLLGLRGIGRKYAAVIAAWQTQARFSHDVDWVGPMIIEDAGRVLALRERIEQIEASCAALVKQSTDAQVIDSLPGFGLVWSVRPRWPARLAPSNALRMTAAWQCIWAWRRSITVLARCVVRRSRGRLTGEHARP